MKTRVGALLVALAWCGMGWAQVTDGDFETEGSPVWQSVGKGINTRRVAPPGWAHLSSKFKSGEYAELRLYLRLQSGTGSVSFDHVRVGDLAVKNPGFEEGEGDRLTGWEQDDVGQAIFGDTGDVATGARCLLIRKAKPGMSRVWQELACQANTEYEASVWVRPRAFQGDAYAQIYGMRQGQYGRIVWESDHVTGQARVELGKAVLEVRGASAEPAGVEQQITLEPGRNWFLFADLAAPRLGSGRVTVGVWSGEQLLAEVFLDSESQGWVTGRTMFESAGGPLTVRATATGNEVLAYVDNVVIKEPATGMSADRSRSAEAKENFPLGAKLLVALSPPDSQLLRNGTAIFARRLSEATRGDVGVGFGAGKPGLEVTVEPPAEPVAWPQSEGFVVACSDSGVRVTAPTEVGAFYGLMAVPQLVSPRARGGWQLIAARLEDTPAMPLRAVYMAGVPRDRAQRIMWCERLAALRLNAVVFEDDVWWHLDREADLSLAQEAFADFRSYGLEPIPELQSFGWAHIVLGLYPMGAEGTWAKREGLVLKGEEPTPLAHANVLRSETTDIMVEGAEGNAYERGRDYGVIDGVTKYVYQPDAQPYAIRRKPGSHIPDGATVYASYDYVSRVSSQNCPYCPSEPEVRRIMVEAVKRTVSAFSPPLRYVHIGHDEPAQMNTDSRCLRQNKTNAELLAEDVERLNDAAHEVDPKVRLMMWADAVNPYHNGYQLANGPTADAIALLPRDVIQCVWFYGADQPLKEGAESLRYFAVKGFTTTGSPWYDKTCVLRWAQACQASRQRGEDCLGMVYTSWGDRWDALEAFAQNAWAPTPVTSEGEAVGGR